MLFMWSSGLKCWVCLMQTFWWRDLYKKRWAVPLWTELVSAQVGMPVFCSVIICHSTFQSLIHPASLSARLQNVVSVKPFPSALYLYYFKQSMPSGWLCLCPPPPPPGLPVQLCVLRNIINLIHLIDSKKDLMKMSTLGMCPKRAH